MLSGFLMCHIGAAELRKHGVLRFPMFMLRRFLRLWPLLFGSQWKALADCGPKWRLLADPFGPTQREQ